MPPKKKAERHAVERPELLVDTSVAVALVVADHESHERVVDEVGVLDLGLAGHAWFETYSVLTRLPPPARRSAHEAALVMAANFGHSRFLDEETQEHLLDQLVRMGIAGGSVYDALVGATAVHHGIPLATRDARARATYAALHVDVRWIGGR